MHRATLLPIIIIAAVAIGGLLYLYGGPDFHPGPASGTSQSQTPGTPNVPPSGLHLNILAQGQNAPGIDQRVNYRVVNADQLSALWQIIYTDNGQAVPSVDFNRYEVLALFDGSHSTGGYGIQITGINDTNSQRVVSITHIEPGDSCVPSADLTSPFVIVQVQKSSLPISRVEKVFTTQCE